MEDVEKGLVEEDVRSPGKLLLTLRLTRYSDGRATLVFKGNCPMVPVVLASQVLMSETRQKECQANTRQHKRAKQLKRKMILEDKRPDFGANEGFFVEDKATHLSSKTP